MKILILGATGFSGKAVLAEALKQQHLVTVLVRDRSKLSLSSGNLTVIQGDIFDSAALSAALKNQEAVIHCLGINGKGNGKPTTFLSAATSFLIDEMSRSGVRRLIAMSNVGAGNSIAFLPRIFTKFILPYFMKWLQVIIDDKNRMEQAIMNSNLDWTIVRLPNITDKPAKNTCTATLDGKGLKLAITLPDMAKFLVRQLNDKDYIRQAPSVSN